MGQKIARRRDLIPATEVRRVRKILDMTLAEFAEALDVNPRTVGRGESRGLEVPMREKSRRPWVRYAWLRLHAKAAKL